MLITRTPEFTCPCGAVLNATASPTVAEAAEPGDFTICFKCERVYRFDDSMGMIELTQEQVLNELTSDDAASILESIEQLHTFKARHRNQS